ncbi:MAG: carbamoyltransferase HypF [Alphaproteobacteria bacterium]|nr:carbamoyltransferase HypF [Alphaproteobacteria bacterium]
MPAEPLTAERARAVETVEIRVRGTVQGVGFRPTVWRLAREHGLVGKVLNDSAGVLITTTGDQERIADFLQELESDPPPLSRIEALEVQRLARIVDFPDFAIADSLGGGTRTNVAPDAALCAACRDEVLGPGERRYRYPFANCTHCGPRFSIVANIPYDRANTSMADFPMCADCAREYEDPADRRFHAQPIACADCGPRVWLKPLEASTPPAAFDAAPIDETVRLLREGAVVAIRGLGGFHLACDAANAQAVDRLRARKRRFGKPFALMARDVEMVRRFCSVSELEAEQLSSPAAPIVLLEADGPETLPSSVAPGLSTLGIMLPYTPLHLPITRDLEAPLVMTSGNVVHEPQVIDNADVLDKLSGIADAVLFHDRDILNRIDDSVVRVMAGRPHLLRRARGFAPAPTALPEGFERAPEILAFGAELKSTFCLIKDGGAVLSQHQGDLEDAATFDDYQKNLKLYTALYQHKPRVLAADMHPEYLSTKFAREHAVESGARLHEVQHHHAHIASTMAENGLALDGPPVIGVAMDGLGFGDDGTIWGGEFLLADYRGFRRLGSLKPVAMIGGAQAIREPWRNTFAHLREAFGWNGFLDAHGDLPLARRLSEKPVETFEAMLARGLNVPPASSCGRLFDAVAAALGLGADQALFEGQGAMELEDKVDAAALDAARDLGGYGFQRRERGEVGRIELDPTPLWSALLEDLRIERPIGVIAARFHLGLSEAIVDLAIEFARKNENDGIKPDTVALSGGCFQNKILLESCVSGIEREKLTCITQSGVTSNDGGLSLGQAVIAAAREIDRREPDQRPTLRRN